MDYFIYKTDSFKKAEDFKKKLNKALSPQERLNDVQICREQYFKLKGLDESRKRLRRILKIMVHSCLSCTDFCKLLIYKEKSKNNT